MSRFINPIPQYKPNSKLFFFKSGTNTQLITYKDQFEETENTHPVLTDSAGFVPNIFFSGSAKLIVLDENDVQYIDRDPVGGEKEVGDFNLWETVITYDKNDIVEGSDGGFYKSLANGNQGDDPTITNESWEEIRFVGVWNTNITYFIGDVVQSTKGNLWKALTATSGNDPEIDGGTNWDVAVSISDLWVNKSAGFNVDAGVKYQIDGSGGAVDGALSAFYNVGEQITVHNESISTNLVRLTNTALTIKGVGDTLSPGDGLILEPGNTACLVAKTTTILEAV